MVLTKTPTPLARLERRADIGLGNAPHELHVPHARREHESQLAFGGLFVPGHNRQYLVGRQPRRLRWQPQGQQQFELTAYKRGVDARQRFGQSRGAGHTDRNGFAVQELSVTGQRFESVAERVTIVEHGSQPRLLALVR